MTCKSCGLEKGWSQDEIFLSRRLSELEVLIKSSSFKREGDRMKMQRVILKIRQHLL